jgi:hypothetical protein
MKQISQRARRLGGASAVGLMALALLAAPSATLAKSGAVQAAGSCTGAATTKIKASPENGKLQVEFEVDQARVGQTWHVVLRHNGTAFWSGNKTANAGGGFTVSKITNNAAGADTFRGRAVNNVTGQVCTAHVSI